MGLWDELFTGKNEDKINELLVNPTEYIQKADERLADLEKAITHQLEHTDNILKSRDEVIEERKKAEEERDLLLSSREEFEKELEEKYKEKTIKTEEELKLKYLQKIAEDEKMYAHDIHMYQESMFDKLLDTFGGMIKLEVKSEVLSEKISKKVSHNK